MSNEEHFNKVVDGFCSQGYNTIVDLSEEDQEFLTDLLDLIDELEKQGGYPIE